MRVPYARPESHYLTILGSSLGLYPRMVSPLSTIRDGGACEVCGTEVLALLSSIRGWGLAAPQTATTEVALLASTHPCLGEWLEGVEGTVTEDTEYRHKSTAMASRSAGGRAADARCV